MALGQTKTVTGQVKDSKGDPIPFATVKIKGTNNATAADANGKFTINAPANATFVISAVGFEGTELKAGSSGTVLIALNSSETMSEVVVTALGIKRSKNTLPYAAQIVQATTLVKIAPVMPLPRFQVKYQGCKLTRATVWVALPIL